jgi:hypothetical protein
MHRIQRRDRVVAAMPILSPFLESGIRAMHGLSITSNESWLAWFTPGLMLKTYCGAVDESLKLLRPMTLHRSDAQQLSLTKSASVADTCSASLRQND